MKKILVILLALLMVLGLAGCGEYKPPVGGGTDGPGEEEPGGDKPGKPDEPDGNVFTVALYEYYNGNKTRPYTRNVKFNALWHDIESSAIYRSEFKDGVASAEGLDGDYKVTLSALPDGYAYDPNNNYTDNDNRSIRVYLYPINQPSVKVKWPGTRYDVTSINNMRGAFRATVNSADDIIRFVYTTTDYGLYSIESIIDTTANVINPIVDVYDGSSAYVNESSRDTQDSGGASNTYTKNFRYERTMSQGWTFYFCIRAEGLNEIAYPIDIDFILDKDGELTPDEKFETVQATEAKPYEFPSGTFKTVASLDETGRNILNGKLFKLDDRKQINGQDNPEYGHYRFYDEVTDTYGGTLFTKINQDWELIATDSGTGFMDGLVAKRFYGKNYIDMLTAYTAYTNTDGVYPVTQELKDFLMNFSIAQGYFLDGNGWVEPNKDNPNGYNSSEKNQWLFPCGYYTR